MAEGGKDPNTEKWEAFLEPLKTKSASVISVENEKGENLSTEELCFQNPLLFNFIEKLKSQELVHNREKEDKLSQKKLEMEIPNETFYTLLKAFKEYTQIGSQKPDITKSGSTWTLDMLAKYFSLHCNDVYTRMPSIFGDWEPQPNTNQEARKEIQNILISLGVKTPSYFEASLFTCTYTGLHCLESFPLLREYSVRTILDSILQSICRQARDEANFAIQLVHEFPIKSDCLPTNILDYGLLVNGLALVGIVEAKTPRTMNQNAVAQLVIQLMSLLTKNPQSSHFGVLTDGYRFLFAYANKDGVYFENKYHDDGKVTVLVHEAGTWRDLDSIKIKILNLCCTVHQFQLNPKNTVPPFQKECLRFTKAFPFEDSSLTNQSQEPQGQDNYTSLPLDMQGLNIEGSYPTEYSPAQPTYCSYPMNPGCPPYSLLVNTPRTFSAQPTYGSYPINPGCPPYSLLVNTPRAFLAQPTYGSYPMNPGCSPYPPYG